VTLEMAAGLTITSLQRSKRDNIEAQRSSLAKNITLQLTTGLWLACFLSWQQETFCLSLGTAATRSTPKMTTTLL